ncbi:MAG: L-threonylcarbamoyladenylate synthase [Pseudomonadota bacterium]
MNLSETRSTKVIRVEACTPDPAAIHTAAQVIQNGGLVAFPTETVYGLGANALDADAIRSIYRAKQRPSGDPIIAHIYSLAQLDQLAQHVPPAALAFAEAFWPGPLTLILRRAPEIPAVLAEGMDTIAVRMPAHPVATSLLRTANLPIGAPSANRFTRPSATSADHVLEDLAGRIDLLLDGGPSNIGIESTVLDLTEHPRILRPGGITLDALRAVVPEVTTASRFLGEKELSISPGQMLKHYSPRAQLLLYRGPDSAVLARQAENCADAEAAGQRSGVLALATDELAFPANTLVERLPKDSSLAGVSNALFAAIRTLDSQGCDIILARDFGRSGLGEAIWDRLLRAAEGKVIDVA